MTKSIHSHISSSSRTTTYTWADSLLNTSSYFLTYIFVVPAPWLSNCGIKQSWPVISKPPLPWLSNQDRSHHPTICDFGDLRFANEWKIDGPPLWIDPYPVPHLLPHGKNEAFRRRNKIAILFSLFSFIVLFLGDPKMHGSGGWWLAFFGHQQGFMHPRRSGKEMLGRVG